MNKELLFLIEAIANEKNLSQADVATAVEFALAGAIRKTQAKEMNVRVKLDPKTGDYDAFRVWQIVNPDDMPLIEQDDQLVPEVFNENTMISLLDAQKINPQLSLDDHLEETIEKVSFGRIGAQTAKQVIFQKLREISRRKIAEQFQSQIGEILHTTIKRTERGRVVLDLGDNVEGSLLFSQQIPAENYSTGKRVRAYLYEVGLDHRSPQIYLSRSMPAMVEELMRMEVPEIADGVIEVKAVAREPGERAKVAVFTGDPHLDPVGACVGMRGARVHAVSNELSGERIDIIIWDSNPAQFVMNALSADKISSISVDETNRTMNISVAEDALAQTIGKGGQNVRLASELTGWNLNVLSNQEMQQQVQQQKQDLISVFADSLQISEDLAKTLVQANINSVEEVAFLPENELLALPGMDQDSVTNIRNKANDAMLTSMLEDDQ